MPLFNQIFVRSPKVINVPGTSTSDIASVEIYIWNNGQTQPLLPTYTVSKKIPSLDQLTVYFDIAPYLREYIEHLSFVPVTDMTQANDNEWCYCKIDVKLNKTLLYFDYFAAFDGYGYYDNGMNPTLSEIHLDDGTYYVEQVVTGGGIYFYNNTFATYSVTYTGLTSGATTSYNFDDNYNYIPYVHDNYIGQGNKVEIFKNSVLINTYIFEEICEPKYTPLKCDFVNRYGSWQRIIFFKASYQSFEANGSQFNLMPDNVDYNILENRKQVFNRNGNESIKANTGFVPESYGEVMKQLLLSEKILIDDKPVNVKTSSLDLQKHINKKLVNYEVEFVYSHESKNYVL